MRPWLLGVSLILPGPHPWTPESVALPWSEEALLPRTVEESLIRGTPGDLSRDVPSPKDELVLSWVVPSPKDELVISWGVGVSPELSTPLSPL